jgi:hypothetical protein
VSATFANIEPLVLAVDTAMQRWRLISGRPPLFEPRSFLVSTVGRLVDDSSDALTRIADHTNRDYTLGQDEGS